LGFLSLQGEEIVPVKKRKKKKKKKRRREEIVSTQKIRRRRNSFMVKKCHFNLLLYNEIIFFSANGQKRKPILI
jgi:hypothetical protein